MTDTTAPKCSDCRHSYADGKGCFSADTGALLSRINREHESECGPTARYFEAKKNDE